MSDTLKLVDESKHRASVSPRRPRLGDYAPVRSGVTRTSAAALVVFVALLCLPPVYFVIDSAVSDDAAGLRQMLDDPDLGATLRVTALLAFGSVVISTILGTLLAWGAQGLSRGRQWLSFLPLVPLVMPALASVTGFVYLLDARIGYGNQLLRKLPFWSDLRRGPLDVNTVPFVLFVTATVLTSFVYLFVRSALAQLDQGIYDAAAASGASPTRTFFTVVLPLLRPALVYSSLTVMLLALGQFAIPLFLGRQQNITVLSTAMFQSMAQSPPNIPLAAAYGLPIIVTGLIFIVIQRVALRDQDRFAGTGTKGAARSLRKSGWLSQGALLVYGIVAVIAPIGSVVIVAFQPYWSRDIMWDQFTGMHFREVFENPLLSESIRNSIVYALTAAAIVVPLGYLIAKLLYRRAEHRVLAAVADVLGSASLGIPAVIFGVGFLLAYTQGPLNLYGKSFGLIVVYVVLTVPFVTRVFYVGMVNLGSNLVDAGAACGGRMWRRTLTLELPMLRSAVGSAIAIALILTSQEFAASVLVRSTRTQVMGTAMYDNFVNGNNSAVAVMALVMCGITGVGVVLALMLGRPSRRKAL